MPTAPTALAQDHNTPTIRPAVIGDWAFLCATFKQSFWRESPWARRIRWSVFAENHEPIVHRVLQRSEVLVACDRTDEDQIAGYLVFEPKATPPVLHFAYVKPAFRRAGVFRALLGASGLPQDLDGVEVTHATKAWFSLAPVIDKATGAITRDGKPGLEEHFRAVHNPYRAFIA